MQYAGETHPSSQCHMLIKYGMPPVNCQVLLSEFAIITTALVLPVLRKRVRTQKLRLVGGERPSAAQEHDVVTVAVLRLGHGRRRGVSGGARSPSCNMAGLHSPF